MGLYMYLTDYDRIKMKSVLFNDNINTELQEALKYDNSILISSYERITKHWFKIDTVETFYQVYHDVNPNESPYQARLQSSASGKENVVIAYLHGIINGIEHNKKLHK